MSGDNVEQAVALNARWWQTPLSLYAPIQPVNQTSQIQKLARHSKGQ
jgi:hypothetical protein